MVTRFQLPANVGLAAIRAVSEDAQWTQEKILNYLSPCKHWMKSVSKLKISLVSPRKINAVLCQVPAVTVVLFNVCKASATQFAVQQKCA